jgi:hypothetical protein
VTDDRLLSNHTYKQTNKQTVLPNPKNDNFSCIYSCFVLYLISYDVMFTFVGNAGVQFANAFDSG